MFLKKSSREIYFARPSSSISVFGLFEFEWFLKEAFFLLISTNFQSLLFNSLYSRNVTDDKEVVESLDLIVNSGKALEESL